MSIYSNLELMQTTQTLNNKNMTITFYKYLQFFKNYQDLDILPLLNIFKPKIFLILYIILESSMD